MTRSEPQPPSQRVGAEYISEVTASCILQWSECCGAFLDWEKQSILLGEPTEKDRFEHRRGLKFLLRLTRLLYAAVADPDSPEPSLAKELRGRLRQLESSWAIFYERMPEAEAKRALAQYFPDESRP